MKQERIKRRIERYRAYFEKANQEANSHYMEWRKNPVYYPCSKTAYRRMRRASDRADRHHSKIVELEAELRRMQGC